MCDFFVHESAVIDHPVRIGEGTRIWHFCHISQGSLIGSDCVLGQNVFVGCDVSIGNRVKIQNSVSIYSGCRLEDDVFLGPGCVLTNITNPRAEIDRSGLYEETLFLRGATVGANATIVCGITIGRYAFIGAGSVVTRDVPDYALVVGNPGRQQGWMSRHGQPLDQPNRDGIRVCRESGFRYKIVGDSMRCLDLDEHQLLPETQLTGSHSYDYYKSLLK